MSITHWIGAMRLAKGKKINKKVWEAVSEGARTYGAEKKNKKQQLRYTHTERERENSCEIKKNEKKWGRDEEKDKQMEWCTLSWMTQGSFYNLELYQQGKDCEGVAAHSSIRIGWVPCQKNAVSNQVWRDCTLTDASIIYKRSNSCHYQV